MISPDSMRHEAYMKKKFEELGKDEEKLLDTFYAERADMVNSPPHYNQAGIECIDAIEAATSDGYEYYLQGNIIKYLWRYRYKNGVEDLKKARWYLDKLIEETNNE
jgi:hypothetical protein